jgi:hypothetical protein
MVPGHNSATWAEASSTLRHELSRAIIDAPRRRDLEGRADKEKMALSSVA